MWKLIAVYAPVLGATLIAGALTIDEFHNWYDCLAGAIIGTFFAFSSYRMVYAAIWDWRINHIPLNRAIPFVPGEAELENAVFTHKAGWDAVGGHRHESGVGGTGTGYGHNSESYGLRNMGNGHNGALSGHNGAGNSASLGRKPVPAHHRGGSDNIV